VEAGGVPDVAPVYDVVVIGSGLGGLMAAARCARAGRSVLVVEQADDVGGYAHAFARGPFRFDAGIHGTSFGRIEPTLQSLLDELGVGDRVEFLPCGEPHFAAVFPGLRFDAANGAEAFVEAHAALEPRDAEAVRRLYAEMQRVTDELARPRPTGSLESLGQAEGSFEALLRYRSATLGEVLDELGLSSRMQAVVAASWISLGLPPSRLAFLAWAPLTVVRVETGEHYCRGTFQSLVDALLHAVRAAGGDVVTGTAASRIAVEGERVSGVELADGSTVQAAAVISNVDPRQTFERLLGSELLPAAFARRLARMRESLSAFVLYAAAALPSDAVDLPHVSYVHDTWDHEEAYERMARGEPSSLMLTVPTLTDASVAPEGHQLVNCVALVGRGDDAAWAQAKDAHVERLVTRVDELIPGFADNLVFAEGAAPQARERHTWNFRGAAYGWENSPAQIGSKRLSASTPVAGLFLAGQWAQPGTGSLAALYSGVRAANLALGRPAEHLGPGV
jgi:prolycopene isomerase